MVESSRPKVHSIAIELTAHCNQQCAYCYNAWRGQETARDSEERGEDQLARARKLVAELDVGHLTLTGGEPLSRPQVWDLLELASEQGIGAQIISNGTLVTKAIAQRLAHHQVRYVQVTLNGPTAALHGEHAGGEAYFEATLRGIRALSDQGVPVAGCMVVTQKNASAVAETLNLWQRLGVTQIALSRFSPAGHAVAQAARLLPSRGDMIEALDQALPFARDQGMRISATMPIPPCVMETDDYAPIGLGHCAIGTTMQEFALGPGGKLRNCTLHDRAIGGVTDILDPAVAVAELVTDAEVTSYRSKIPEFCEACLHAASCGGGCGAAADWMLGTGPKRQPDPFLWQHIDDDFEARLAVQRSADRHGRG
jgi:radical SAM protein with 4Fe4S-binding SPASM domain